MDNEKSLQDQIAFLTDMLFETNGQLVAMGAAIKSLLLTHPDRERAIETMTSEFSPWETAGLYSSAPDVSLKGIARAKRQVLPSADDLQRVP